MNGREIGMAQDSGSLGFLFESAQAIGILRERRREDLDRDITPESRVLGPIDFAHPARPDGRQDLVGTEAGTRRECHRSSERLQRNRAPAVSVIGYSTDYNAPRS